MLSANAAGLKQDARFE